MSKTYDMIRKYTLNGRANSDITLKVGFLKESIDKIIFENSRAKTEEIIEIVELKLDEFTDKYEISEHVGLDTKSKEFLKFKKDFLFELTNAIKKN